MFAAFKEEFDKAKAGEDELDGEELEEQADAPETVEEDIDEADAAIDEYEDDDDDDEPASKSNPGIGGMFAAFKSEFDKAAKGE